MFIFCWYLTLYVFWNCAGIWKSTASGSISPSMDNVAVPSLFTGGGYTSIVTNLYAKKGAISSPIKSTGDI